MPELYRAIAAVQQNDGERQVADRMGFGCTKRRRGEVKGPAGDYKNGPLGSKAVAISGRNDRSVKVAQEATCGIAIASMAPAHRR